MRVITLASGSKGNCTLIEGSSTKLLVDAGISAKELERRLLLAGVKPKDVYGILVTHEHTDHTGGIRNFAIKYGTRIYVHRLLYEFFKLEFFGIKDYQLIPFENSDFFINEFAITPFEVSHDAKHTNGFCFLYGGRKVTIATDIGYVTENNLQNFLYSDLMILECNHDIDMLVNGPYPLTLKRRILSKKGHLSNIDCAKTIAYLTQNGTKNFVLAHMSEKNNTEEKAKLACFNELESRELLSEVRISIAYQDKLGTNYILKTE